MPEDATALMIGATIGEYRLATRFALERLSFLAPSEKFFASLHAGAKASTTVANLRKAMEHAGKCKHAFTTNKMLNSALTAWVASQPKTQEIQEVLLQF